MNKIHKILFPYNQEEIDDDRIMYIDIIKEVNTLCENEHSHHILIILARFLDIKIRPTTGLNELCNLIISNIDYNLKYNITDLTKNFTKIYGPEKVKLIFSFLINNDLLENFYNIENNDDLLRFSVEYGLCDIVQFLYEYYLTEYEINLLQSFDSKLKTEDVSPYTLKGTATTGSSNVELKTQRWDRFSNARKQCIRYLVNMRKYSRSRMDKNQFYYRLKSKYMKNI
uniref:Uncharacterized protein n=1 Tax=Pithovirus LCPAC302 TaxID=2506593 RepID=A0A481Z7R6_9VIRU|nr:MAG: uncharacterized protein LCPAC302_01650 [Pithovirus LCPAC302]